MIRAIHHVVFADLATDRQPGMFVQTREHRVQGLAAHIVEINVDAVGAVFVERSANIQFLVVEGLVETQHVFHMRNLRIAPRAAHDPRARNSAELSRHTANRPAGRRDENRLSRLRLAVLQHARIGGKARHAENRNTVADRSVRRIDMPERHIRRLTRIVRPGEKTPDIVAFRKTVAARFLDLTDHARGQRQTQFERPPAVTALAHLTAHIRIAGKIDIANQDLSVRRFGHSRVE